MAKWKDILGKNARNRIYLRLNKKKGRKLADSKLKTKSFLLKNGLPAPELYAAFKNSREVIQFAWEQLPGHFVLKPSEGYGGEGIIVVKKKAKWAGEWELMDGSVINVGFLRMHALDILAGKYSLHGGRDIAFVEERVKIHRIFRKYAYQGTPDVRVIVFNKVPVMAMLRLPTRESHGKANLHQGAIGVGIDMATGITTYGVLHNQPIRYLPGTKRKLNGIKIPFWDKILALSVQIQENVPSLGFLGVDFVVSRKKGPMVLELNARPGLSIQIANRAGLRRRLERVEGLEVRSAEQGAKIAQTLFAESFADKVKAKKGIRIVNVVEEVRVVAGDGKTKVAVKAKIDTGAFRSSIDKKLAQELGLLKPENILWKKRFHYRSATGIETRPVIGLSFYLAGRKTKTIANVADRSKLSTSLLIGRNDLKPFLVRVEEE
jgi:alpha-L-glutamate ligase-like protein